MRFLADTQILIWAAIRTRPRNEITFSVASIWEIAIKSGRGRDDFDIDPTIFRDSLIANQFVELLITGAHAQTVVSLPPVHRDPFDRMLVAQAFVEGLVLLTSDPRIVEYGGNVRKV